MLNHDSLLCRKHVLARNRSSCFVTLSCTGLYAEVRHLASVSRHACNAVLIGVREQVKFAERIWPALVRLQGLCRSSVQIPGKSPGFTRQARPEARVFVNREPQALSGRPSDFAAQGILPPDMFSRTSETSVLRGCNAGY